VLWLLPSVVLTPVIIYWARRVRQPARPVRNEPAYVETPVSS